MSNPEIMWSKAFAWNATNKNTIQEQRQPSQDVQDATLNDGFPLITMTPQEAGGIAPNGQDMNGALYAISSNMVHRQKGLRIQFDLAYAAKIGGYDQGCILASNDYTRDYISLVSNNLTDPNGSGTTGRWAIYSGAGSIASATASIAGIVKIVDSLSSTATDAALTANQGKVLGDRTQQAEIDNVGITRFATLAETNSRSILPVAVRPNDAGIIADAKAFGLGQNTFVYAAPTRQKGATYINTTVKPIEVSIVVGGGPSSSGNEILRNGIAIFVFDVHTAMTAPFTFTVPPGQTYRINVTSNIISWSELR